MITKFRGAFFFFLLNSVFSVNASEQGDRVELRAETWDMPRHGEALLNVPELSTIVKGWMRDTRQKIELRYPGGEAGELWVEELRGWLVSLGVPSKAILLTPGSDAEDIINMGLIKVVRNK